MENSNEELLKNIKNEVSGLLGNDTSGHGADHAFRVYDMAMKIYEKEGGDKEIVGLAALLHDCDDYKLFGIESSNNLTNAKAIMKKYCIEEEKQKQVCTIISTMGYSKLLAGIRPTTLEGQIVSDADMLDGMGAFGIIRTLTYTLNKSHQIFDKNIFPDSNISSEEYKKNRTSNSFINHFFEKLLKLRNLMLTKIGKKEAQNRHELMVFFLRQFFKEQNLDDWNAFLEKFLLEI